MSKQEKDLYNSLQTEDLIDIIDNEYISSRRSCEDYNNVD